MYLLYIWFIYLSFSCTCHSILFEPTPDFDALLHLVDSECVPPTTLSYPVLITGKCSELTETVSIKMK